MKKISVAVCLDDELGMMFFGKRQTRDRVLCAEFLECEKDRKIYVNSFSSALFADAENLVISEEPLSDCGDGNIAFIENLDIKPHISDIVEFIIYRWNRCYPSDKKFDIDLKKEKFELVSYYEFEGSSHENIRKEIYRR